MAQPGEEKKRNPKWDTVQTVAITTLVGLAVAGVGTAAWRLATKRAKRLFRSEQQLERESIAQQQQAYAMPAYGQTAPPFPMGAAAYPAYGMAGWGVAQSVRDQMPDALRDIPQFHSVHHVAAPPITVAAPPPPQIPMPSSDPTLRKFMNDMSRRLSSIEKSLQDVDDDSDDDGDEDDDN